VCTLGEKYLCASLRFERDNKESGVTQPDEVWLCESADLFCENLTGKDTSRGALKTRRQMHLSDSE